MLRRRIRIDLPVWEFIIWGIAPWLLSGFYLGLLVSNAYPADLPDDPVQRVAAVTGKVALNFEALPTDPIARVAMKAILGFFGELTAWQHKAYTLLLKHGPAREGQAYVTHYTPPKFKRGQATAFGWACTEGCWAANNLPKYWYVLVQNPNNGFWEMGWIRDCGASWNDAHWKQKAKRMGITVDIWLDRWTPDTSLGLVSWQGAKYIAISAQKTW